MVPMLVVVGAQHHLRIRVRYVQYRRFPAVVTFQYMLLTVRATELVYVEKTDIPFTDPRGLKEAVTVGDSFGQLVA